MSVFNRLKIFIRKKGDSQVPCSHFVLLSLTTYKCCLSDFDLEPLPPLSLSSVHCTNHSENAIF